MLKRTRVTILICCLVVLAGGTAFAASRLGRHKAATTLPTAGCGTAVTHQIGADTVVLSADPGALSCFDAAAAGCRPASLQIGVQGVDAGTTVVYRVDSGSTPCRVTALSQSYVAPRGVTSPVRSSTCDRTGVSPGGVTLTCDGQKVLIPSTVGREHPGG